MNTLTARRELTHAVRTLARSEHDRTGVGGFLAVDAPDTWLRLQSVNLGSGLPVWSGGSDRTPYLRPVDNYAFRYWHDLGGHLRYGLSFSPRDEQTLQWEHHVPAVARLVSRDALQLYIADVVGQIEYQQTTGRFPDDQLSFDVAYARDRDAALAGAF